MMARYTVAYNAIRPRESLGRSGAPKPAGSFEVEPLRSNLCDRMSLPQARARFSNERVLPTRTCGFAKGATPKPAKALCESLSFNQMFYPRACQYKSNADAKFSAFITVLPWPVLDTRRSLVARFSAFITVLPWASSESSEGPARDSQLLSLFYPRQPRNPARPGSRFSAFITVLPSPAPKPGKARREILSFYHCFTRPVPESSEARRGILSFYHCFTPASPDTRRTRSRDPQLLSILYGLEETVKHVHRLEVASTSVGHCNLQLQPSCNQQQAFACRRI